MVRISGPGTAAYPVGTGAEPCAVPAGERPSPPSGTEGYGSICRIVSAHMMDEDVIKALNRKDTTETDCRG